jgi:transcriptional regulator with XRE-family HTH domain
MDADYNHIREWLNPHLDRLGMSVEQFANACGISKASVYFYMEDRYRPNAGIMSAMCRVLGVPLEQGLHQYTPRKSGRPAGGKKSYRVSAR